ncbi:hypothetical protein E2C01_087208 [Portunus trituberculatus]|uniref:Uncharacterized protein n=1 Tax=Portunus trituberculatus TaxID=210409 RepID=A0A5B7JDG3_PORTR|nr:hypothetical protein [Portunus trituberculatus]
MRKQPGHTPTLSCHYARGVSCRSIITTHSRLRPEPPSRSDINRSASGRAATVARHDVFVLPGVAAPSTLLRALPHILFPPKAPRHHV